MPGKRWTRLEDEFLRHQWRRNNAKTIGETLGRSATAVSRRASHLGVTARNRVGKSFIKRRWTNAEDDYVRDRYQMMTAEQIGQELDRTPSAVHLRARTLGVKSNRTRGRHWTNEEDQKLWWMWGSFAVTQIAEQLDRTITACHARAKQMGIGSPDRDKMTIKEVSRKLNCSEDKVHNAIKYLDMQVKKGWRSDIMKTKRIHTSKWKHWALTPEQVYEIEKFLKAYPKGRPIVDTRWGKKGRPGACLDCNSNEKPHKAKGLCATCYAKRRRQS